MSECMNPTEEELLRNEVESLKALLSVETERNSILVAEITRLHEAQHQTIQSVQQLRNERDAFRKQLEDQLNFRRAPLEAQLTEANRVLAEQRLQFRSMVDVMTAQRDWVREWAVQCQENMRLQDVLAKREAGTEVEELRTLLLDMHARCAELTLALKQKDAVVAVAESKTRSLALQKEKIVAENRSLKEKNGRLWMRIEKNAVQKNAKSPACR